jgi:hypothetical protein
VRSRLRAISLLIGATVAFSLNYHAFAATGSVPPYSVFFGPLLLVYGVAGLVRPSILSGNERTTPHLGSIRFALGLAGLALSVIVILVWQPR